MRRLAARAVMYAAAAAMVAATAVVVPSAPALANTQCVDGRNAGYSNGGSGDWYWGWCRPNGGTVRFHLILSCLFSGAQATDTASGSGYGTIYTDAVYCIQIEGYQIVND